MMDNEEVGMPAVPVCAIGASAGGVEALKEFFQHAPHDLGVAYVVIIHLAPDHPSSLSEILRSVTSMSVCQIDDSPALEPDRVYVIAPDRELVLDDHGIASRPFSDPRGQRAPIDMFFRSVASARGDGIAVILSGAGSDGALGVRAMKESGAVIFVQDPADATFPAMPRSALASGCVDFVAPIPRLVERMVEVAQSKEAVRSLPQDAAQHELQRIVSFLRTRTGHDFSSYKRATVMRRVVRRMQVARVTELTEYASYLMANPEEAQELFGELLISVTSFFRDPEAFDALAKDGVAAIFENADEGGIRAWVVGCATGEEAYSLAILLLEEAQRRDVRVPIQIFATDLDEGALATAREGLYPVSIEADLAPERLTRFFSKEGLHYRIKKQVRDVVLFATHSVLKDPPFMRLDLVTCRNLMIYLERQSQREVCALFAYGLRPGGLLFLGSAESTDTSPELFSPVNRAAQIYRARKLASKRLPVVSRMPAEHRPLSMQPDRPERRITTGQNVGTLHAHALEHAAPPSILVDESHNAMHLSSNAGRFLLSSGGPASTHLPDMVRSELRLDLRTALRHAFDDLKPTLTRPVPVLLESERRRVMMQVSPVIPDDPSAPAAALVVFLDGGPMPERDNQEAGAASQNEVALLRDELDAAEQRLIASRAENETSIQNLRTANEELQSINEEYRSTSEELETSKEELQSLNEELQTVNAELKNKLRTIGAAHSDLENLVAATDIGTLFLDQKLRIRMFTPRMARIFNVTEADIGRAITDFTHRLEYQDLAEDAAKVLRDLAPFEREVRSSDGRWLILGMRPYRTVDNRIEGAVITLVDVTALHEITERLRENEDRQSFLLNLSDNLRPMADPLEIQSVTCNLLLRKLKVDRAVFLQMQEASDDIDVGIEHVGDGENSHVKNWSMPDLSTSVNALRRGECIAVEDLRSAHSASETDGEKGANASPVALLCAPLFQEGGFIGALCVACDQPRKWEAAEISMLHSVADRVGPTLERARAQSALSESEKRFRALVSATGDVLYRMAPDWSQMLELDGQGFLSDLSSAEAAWADRYILSDDLPRVKAEIDRAIREKNPFELEHRVRQADGTIGWTFSRAVPILNKEGEISEWFGAASDFTERRQSEEDLRKTRDALALATQASRLGWGSWDMSTGDADWDARGREIIGISEDQNTVADWLERVHPEDRESIEKEIELCIHDGRPFDLEYRVVHPDGSQHIVHGTGTFQSGDGGAGAVGTGLVRDVTEFRKWEEAQRLLVRELNHRVKNMLAIVQSVARQTQRTTDSVEAFTEAFELRIGAIAGAHAILTRRNWSGVELGKLAHQAMSSFTSRGDGRVRIDGPKLDLSPDVTISFAMALHELATNAVKYGSLSVPEGHVDICWRIDEDGHVDFEWTEHNGPEVQPPTRRGFGSQLLERGIAMELEGDVQVEFRREGLRCKVKFKNERTGP